METVFAHGSNSSAELLSAEPAVRQSHPGRLEVARSVCRSLFRMRLATGAMRAIRFHEYGGPEVLRYEDCDQPRLRAGHALVQIEAAGVNPVDWRIRSGRDMTCTGRALPAVPGLDFAGRIIAVGPGVNQFIPGDRVFGQCNADGQGSYADFAAVTCSRLALIPKDLGVLHAAAIPSAALTAWHALHEVGNLQAGHKVLVFGISGCVGLFIAQLARMITDVSVVGVCARNGRGRDVEPWCAQFVDVNDEVGVARLRGQYDLVVNLYGPEFDVRAIAALKRGGCLVTSSPHLDINRCAVRSVRGATLCGRFDRKNLEMLGAMMVKRVLQPPRLRVEHILEAPAIHRLGEGGKLNGKAILIPG